MKADRRAVERSGRSFGQSEERKKLPSEQELVDARILRHGAALQQRFSQAVVAVCGLGGLGSHIAVALVRAGVGRLILADHDVVDITNLNRQQYHISQIGTYKTEALRETLHGIDPYADLVLYTGKLTAADLGMLSDADIICEAFDKPEEKAMLVNGVLEQFPDKYVVAASGMAGIGSSNTIHTRRVAGRFYLCGDEVSDIADGMGLLSARVMLCAAHQANMVLRILAGEYDV